jgi:PAS domain S-box-containing protein
MTEAPNRYETMIARLAADPGMAALARPGAGVLVWDRAAERLLWASPAAQELGAALADGTGRLAPGLRARDRLAALATDPTLLEHARLERLRLDPARPWLPVACTCRVATLDSGETVLVTALAGPIPKTGSRPRPSPAEAGTASQDPAASPRTEPNLREGPRGTIRFLWQADPQTRFTSVSPGLAEAVGPAASDIVGRSWEEVSRSVAEDPDGAVAGLFERRETWSGRTVFWNLDDGARQVPVDWAGMPVFDAERRLTGFRGFGLLRMEAVREREAPGAPPAEDEPAGLEHEASDEAQDKIQDELQDETQDENQDDTWFSHLRDRVAEALSGPRPAEPEPEAKPDDGGARARSGTPPVTFPNGPPGLSDAERQTFREIARALGARLEQDAARAASASPTREAAPDPGALRAEPIPQGSPAPATGDRVLDRLPIGILVRRGERLLFANRFLLDLAGYDDIGQMAEAGLERLFGGLPAGETGQDDSALALTARGGDAVPVKVRLSASEWDGEPADLMVIRRSRETEAARRQREGRVQELEAILDTATDGVIVLDETGRILSLNRSAEALFGYDEHAVVGDAITVLLAPESHIVALDYLEGLRSPGVAGLLNDGREVSGRVRQGGTIPLFMTMGHLNDGPARKFCAVLRDITAFKKTEGELVGAKRAAEEASAQKSDLLAKISHEIRTPLNAIIGFAEVMLEERFGPIGNERYKEYLKDVHASGAHVISLVNDLLDLAKIEAGRLELSFTGVNLNDLVSACVSLLQPQAARDRIVMRMSFAPKLPPVVADERSMRQIVLNLVSNAIKFTDAGGQVIVSTAVTDRGEVAFRVRDTGIGMTEQEIEAALEPFRQLATSRRRGGTGLGLPLTKALVEANRGALQIASHPNEGTLVEVIFPPTRVLAE